MVELSHADKVQQYLKTVVLYKDNPVHVERITDAGKFCIFDLKKQKSSTVEFNFEDFKPPARRIGMVNIMGSVVFITRSPFRKMQIGISKSNTECFYLNLEYPKGRAATLECALQFSSEGIADAMDNNYPSFEEAVKMVSKDHSAVAFDHQFAIDSNREIHYKTRAVGVLDKDVKPSVYNIKFSKGNEQLITLLDNNHEKTYGTPQS